MVRIRVYGIVIRVYGFVHQPYIALELIRQRLIVEDEHFMCYKKPSEIKFPWIVGPFVIKSKSSLQIIESMLKEMGFLVEVVVDYDPYHVISNRRQANKNKPFEHSEVAGLFEAKNWMDYPKDINNGGNMQEDSLSFVVGNTSPKHDISSIVAIATHITPLASFSEKDK